jgi:hypothetical protein
MEELYFIYIIIIVQAVSITLILSSIFYKKFTLLNNIVSKLEVLTGMLTATSIILTYFLFRNTYDKSVNDSTLQMTDRGFLNINKILSENSHKCPGFANSLQFPFQNGDSTDSEYSTHQNEDQITINYISNSIFQSIEDYVLTSKLTHTSDSEWVATFLSYLSSKSLSERWNNLKYNYGLRTHSFVNFLMKINNENKFQNADSVIQYCNKIIFTPEFKNIFTLKDKTIVTFV